MLSNSNSDSDARRWRAEVYVSLKPVVNDPQGLAIRDGLHMLGYEEVDTVRAGKYIEVWVAAPNQETAEQQVAEMCEKLLSNPVIEQYRFTLTADPVNQPV